MFRSPAYILVVASALVVSCGGGDGGGSIGPSATTPAMPTVQGTWVGDYSAQCEERAEIGGCSGGSVGIGSNPPAPLTGTSLPLKLTLTQGGGQVSGTAEFSNFTVPISGTVNATGRLELAGSGIVGPATVAISNWNTTVSGTTMTGSWRTSYVLIGLGVTQVDSTIRRVTQSALGLNRE